MTLVGMVLGMALIRLAAGRPALVWTAFCMLTTVHVWANVRAMRCLRIAGVNQARLGLLLRHYLCQVGGRPALLGAPLMGAHLVHGAARGCSSTRCLASLCHCVPHPMTADPTSAVCPFCECRQPGIPSAPRSLRPPPPGRRPDARPACGEGEPGAAAAAAPAAPAGAGRRGGLGADRGGGAAPGQPGERGAVLSAGGGHLAGAWTAHAGGRAAKAVSKGKQAVRGCLHPMSRLPAAAANAAACRCSHRILHPPGLRWCFAVVWP